MRICDLMLLFAAIFLCGVLSIELQTKETEQVLLARTALNRQMDRITEDALLDIAIEEGNDGYVITDDEKLSTQTARLSELAFDLTTDAERQHFASALPYSAYRRLSMKYGTAQTMALTKEMEDALNGNVLRDARFFAVTLSLGAGDRFVQGVMGPTLMNVSELSYVALPWEEQTRKVVSGARIEKRRYQTDKAYRVYLINDR